MSNPFQPYTSEIVMRLIKMERADSRDWFKAIREFIERRAGGRVASIHDYVTAPVAANGHDVREIVLHDIVLALRAGDIESLSDSACEA